MYELFLCIGISVMGCGAVQVVSVDTKSECVEILREVRFQERGREKTGEDTTDSLAYCRPVKNK